MTHARCENRSAPKARYESVKGIGATALRVLDEKDRTPRLETRPHFQATVLNYLILISLVPDSRVPDVCRRSRRRLPRAAAVLGGESRRLHDSRPTYDLRLDIGQELRAGFTGDLITLGFELAAHVGVVMRRLCRVGEASDDVGRGAGFHQEAKPHARRELRMTELHEGRHVLHRGPTPGACDAERLEL